MQYYKNINKKIFIVSFIDMKQCSNIIDLRTNGIKEHRAFQTVKELNYSHDQA